LGISESCLRNWIARAGIDDRSKPGLSSDERAELAALRRDKRRLELENEILKRAAGGGLPGPAGLDQRLLRLARPAGLSS
jgi:transposase-like protein